MTSQPGKQIIAIHILHNISTTKSNQAIKFGQLTEYNIIPKMWWRNYSQTLFLKIKIQYISGSVA